MFGRLGVLGGSRSKAFSLIELVVVVVIIGIIAAIAIPRMSRGATGAAENSLAANLSVLRGAVELYYQEQGRFPAASSFVDEMTKFTDGQGNTSDTRTGEFVYGPYLRAIPPMPVGENRGATGVASAAGSGVAWVYNETTGRIAPNASGNDTRGNRYSGY
jgi:prepilin-type N-terminal cleavage/methylation domain-containing protein